ncbi:hypothetical protein I4641_23210 [Waterburya agarophytonicola K14]|uniref:Uncharacterized protein n=1 Tax=Waterburya agarophytonicola KI4 TaxID=2874699 RepID=A0A964C0F0_9CYAN|nr:hypothetical protein [Waterburya agarophytonicola]MCC0179851.1 hypothetical protein [Waterburya agarophytonicola KI4]
MSRIYHSLLNIIEQQPEIFSPEDRQDLIEQSSTWSDEPKQFVNSANKWLDARPNIYDAALRSLSSKDNDKSFSGEIRLPGNGTKAPEIKPEDYKPMLLNAIHRSFGNVSQTTATVSTNNR